MGGFADGKTSFSAQTTVQKKAYLDARIAQIKRMEGVSISRSEALGRIFDFWLSVGAPPLINAEASHPKIPVPVEVEMNPVAAWNDYLPKTHSPVHSRIAHVKQTDR